MPRRDIAASVPPATMTSASRKAIMRLASPIACDPVAQAVTTAWFGPLKPNSIDTTPEARLMSEPGMKNGLTRRGPFSASSKVVSSIEGRPPIPDPMRTPVAYLSSSVLGSQPESLTACFAAASA